MNSVIFDVDGTLMNVEHRVQFARGETKDWAAFFAATEFDTPYLDIFDLARSMKDDGYQIIIATGRPEFQRGITIRQLRSNGLDFDRLYMRPKDDRRSDVAVKSDMVDQILTQNYPPKYVVEDRDSVVEMWRSYGIRCLQVRSGNF